MSYMTSMMVSDADEWASNMSFSEALEQYLQLREQGPNESDGYTDNRYYYRMQALRDRMDVLAPVPPKDDEL